MSNRGNRTCPEEIGKVFHSVVMPEKGGLTDCPIPQLNNMSEQEFEERISKNLERIERDVSKIVNDLAIIG